MENLDIVDKNNKLTGETAPRNQIHSEGLWHRVVHICLFRRSNEKIELLVHLRSPFKDLHPNCWDFRFGGHIKAGVSLEKALKNELKEEIGLDLNKHDLIEAGWHTIDTGLNREFAKTYFLEYSGELEDLKFNDGEVQRVKWMEVQEIRELLGKEPKKWTSNEQEFNHVISYLDK